MQLKGTDIDQAITLVQRLAQECDDLVHEFSVQSDGRGKYMDWAERCEIQFRNLFAGSEVPDGVYTERYWRIAELGVIDRLAQVTGSEIRFQADRLQRLLATLHSYLQLRERPGKIVVPDTCVLLHFQRIDKIAWQHVIGAQQVRLVIPLLILDELDDKRYLGSAAIKERARSAVKPLDEDSGGFRTPVPIESVHRFRSFRTPR